jgi:K+-sensing histidine kinase KdpD
MMPEMDGYQVLAHIRSRQATATIPFVFLTSKAEHENVRQGMNLGADDYLTKPFVVTELLETIKTQMKKRSDISDDANKRLDDLRMNIITALPHELRTPLNTVLGFSEMLMAESPHIDRTQLFDWAQHIHSAGQRLLRVAENYLLYARVSIALDSEISLAQYRNEMLLGLTTAVVVQAERVAEKYERKHNIVFDLEDVEAVAISQGDLMKIVEELTDNACKFSPSNTPIIITGKINAPYYDLTFVDRGRGFSKEQRTRVGAYMQFDRWFYEQQGMGLGLAIVVQLVKLYDGMLNIKDALDGGASVTVSFKLTEF